MTSAIKSAEPLRAVKLCGTEEIDSPSRKLIAGPLTAELENGQLRYIAFKGVEALRGIAFLVRDQNWGTYAPRIDTRVSHRRIRKFHRRVQSVMRRRQSAA